MKTTDPFLLTLVLGLSLSVPLAPRAARAEATELDKANARKLFNEGLDLRKAGDQAGALAKFVAADALVPTPKGRLELGRQRVSMGLLVEGHATLLAVAELKVDPKDAPKYAPHKAEAAKLAAEVEARIPSLRIELSGTATVQIDGVPLPSAALAEKRLLNPGKHVVTAKAEGVPEQKQEVTLAEGEHKTVAIKLPSAAPPPPADPPTTVGPPATVGGPPVALHGEGGAPPPSKPPEADVASDLGTQRTVALVTGGVGVVAVVIGGWAGISARSYRDQAAPHCAFAGGGCDPEGLALKRKALDRADVSTWTFVSSAVLLGGAAVLWFTAPSSRGGASGSGGMGLVVGLGSIGLAGGF